MSLPRSFASMTERSMRAQVTRSNKPTTFRRPSRNPQNQDSFGLCAAWSGSITPSSIRDLPRAGVTGRWVQMRRTTAAELRLDHGDAMGSGVVGRAVQRFGSQSGHSRSNFIEARLAETENRAQRTGNPGNAGLDELRTE